MKLEELLHNESVRRHEFPICAESVFLAHAGVCPIPRRVAEAMSRYILECTKGDQEGVFPRGLLLGTRRLAAALLNCATEEVALVGPTSIGLSVVANGLDWRAGDNVVFYPDDYPSNAVPWMALASRGVELREVNPKQLGEIRLEDVAPLVDRRTRLVSLASAHFIGGYRLDLDQMGQWIRSQGALFCVDGIQTLGAFPTMVGHVDFLAADAHKWLLGPCAAGILFVRRESQEKLRPSLLGWNNVSCPGYVTPTQIQFPNHAGRYEAGSPNLIGIAGLHAAISLLLEIGTEAVERTIVEHTRWIRSALRGHGYLLAGSSDENLSGITACRREGLDMAALHRRLAAERVTVSLRKTRDGREWIRISPHFYNTREELTRALQFFE